MPGTSSASWCAAPSITESPIAVTRRNSPAALPSWARSCVTGQRSNVSIKRRQRRGLLIRGGPGRASLVRPTRASPPRRRSLLLPACAFAASLDRTPYRGEGDHRFGKAVPALPSCRGILRRRRHVHEAHAPKREVGGLLRRSRQRQEHRDGHDPDGARCARQRQRPPLRARRAPPLPQLLSQASKRARADRPLDPSVRALRQSQRDYHLQREQRHAVEGDVHAGTRQHHHRPVPEVDAVGAHPDPAQHR